MPLHVLSTSAHRQAAKIVLCSLWYHHTETSEWSKITKITKITKIQFYNNNYYYYYYYYYYLLQLGCHPVAVVILHVHKT